jgi:DMSO/TMAO reductase YedYZ molybdopterin-dependent catalytic subunit
MVRAVLARLTALAHRPLPAPPQRLRRGPWRDGTFRSALRTERLTSHLGLWLGAAFAICFATGLLSHLIQHPPGWFTWPARPVGLYRVTQGLHVATGLATVPLLAAKLWSVYPKLFTWPPARDLLHAAERASVAVLVGAALFQVVSGVLNVARWYTPMPFFFTAAHYWTGWLAAGALLVHIAVQLPVIRRGLAPQPDPPTGGLTRRGLLTAVGAAALTLTVTTAGQTVRPLARLSLLSPRRPDVGPQRLPVNKSATAARVTTLARGPGYRLSVTGPRGRVHLSLTDLAALPQHTVPLPITCVEGWSADAVWTGVRVRDLVALVGADPASRVLVESLQPAGRYRSSTLEPAHAADPLTLLALRLHGEPLHLDHGYPCRLIAPDRPGVLQTKWVHMLTVIP